MIKNMTFLNILVRVHILFATSPVNLWRFDLYTDGEKYIVTHIQIAQ